MKKNIVFILTDTTNRHHLGCYGCKGALTPNTDRLAAEGVRFDRAYSSSPVCTPARGSIFTGLHAPSHGATFNDATVYRNVPFMGEVFAQKGYRVGYTGKWHLDGGRYFGKGKAEGGFPQTWWYDGRCYLDDIGPEKEKIYRGFGRLSWEEMLEAAFDEKDCWGYRITDRAIDFLETAGDEPFLLCVCFDEPHGPFMSPRRNLEAIDSEGYEHRPNVNASLEGKPSHQRELARGHVNSFEDLKGYWRYYAACNNFVDDQIGRIVETVDRLHGDDTIIVFTSDHGELMGSHGTWGKGYVAYDESSRVPLLMRGSGIERGGVAQGLAGHIDLLPTFCELAGIEIPSHAQGTTLVPVLQDVSQTVNEYVHFSYTRFGNEGNPGREGNRGKSPRANQELYPYRAIVDSRYKLVVNLFETDELYDLQDDPYEMTNLIESPDHRDVRERLHRDIIAEMNETLDPYRCAWWERRHWQ